jgi:flagellar biosynthesis/type III secretory pathway protein FliH
LSNLLRGGSFALLDAPSVSSVAAGPRVFGTRVLRGDSVGLQKPMHLAVPTFAAPGLDPSVFDDIEEPIEEEQAPPPDFSELAEAARVQGYNEGYEQGIAAGMAAAEQQMAGILQRLQSVVGNVHETHSGFFRAAERQVVDLALQIAQKVIEREVENMPDLAINVIRAALEEMDARTAVRVRVNPDDEELLRRRWSQVVPPGVGADRIELQKDERVQTGGAIIETSHGQVDAQLESKLQQLGNALWTFVMDANSQPEHAGDVDA